MSLNSEKRGVHATYTEEALQRYLLGLRSRRTSLRGMAKMFGEPILHTDIQRILVGVFPTGAEKRIALGLPALVPASACTACGNVHTVDRGCEVEIVIKKKRRARTKAPRDLFDIPTKRLRWMLENREEF